MRFDSPLAFTSLVFCLTVAACQPSSGDAPAQDVPPSASTAGGATSIATRDQPPATAQPVLVPPPKDGQSRCVTACVQARQMEATAIEVIEANCREECSKNPDAYPR
jgi:hypothetical protein